MFHWLQKRGRPGGRARLELPDHAKILMAELGAVADTHQAQQHGRSDFRTPSSGVSSLLIENPFKISRNPYFSHFLPLSLILFMFRHFPFSVPSRYFFSFPLYFQIFFSLPLTFPQLMWVRGGDPMVPLNIWAHL
jgi:hypothetical protein